MFHRLLKALLLLCGAIVVSTAQAGPEASCKNLLLTYAELRSIAQVSADFDKLTADEKAKILTEKIEATEYDPSRLPSFYAWRDFFGYVGAAVTLGKAFRFGPDFLPPGRPKIIHAVGSTAWVHFITDSSSPYTGIYKSGGRALLRMSPGAPPSLGTFLPGSAFKFLIDNHPSVNFVAMPSLDGQGKNHNPFDFRSVNKLASPTSTPAKTLAAYFGLSHEPTFIPLTELATIDQAGIRVIAPSSPEVLILEPSDEVRAIIPRDSIRDLRVDLATIPVGTVLWTVYGRKLDETAQTLIGHVVLDSQFMASYAGDRLYYRHQR